VNVAACDAATHVVGQERTHERQLLVWVDSLHADHRERFAPVGRAAEFAEVGDLRIEVPRQDVDAESLSDRERRGQQPFDGVRDGAFHSPNSPR
jgi:hypothetical protein